MTLALICTFGPVFIFIAACAAGERYARGRC